MDRFESLKEYANKKAKDEENKNFILQFEYERLLGQLNKLEDRIAKLCSLANYCQEKEIPHFPVSGARISFYPSRPSRCEVIFQSIATRVKGKLFITDGQDVRCESGGYRLEEKVKATSVFVSNFSRFEAKFLNFVDTLTYHNSPIPRFTTSAGYILDDEYRKPFCPKQLIYLSIATTKKELKQIYTDLFEMGFLPMIPQLYFPALDEQTLRECWENWLDISDELWVIGDEISPQMKLEIAFAIDRKIMVRKFASVKQMMAENQPIIQEPEVIEDEIDIKDEIEFTYDDDILPEDSDIKN